MIDAAFVIAAIEKISSAGKVFWHEAQRSLLSPESSTNYSYAVIRDQLEFCQNGGEHSMCSSYCAVPEGTRYKGENTFSPQKIAEIADYLYQNNIRVAASVGAEGYHDKLTPFSWQEGLSQLKPQTAEYIQGYYERVLEQPIDPTKRMNGTQLAIVKDAILKDKGFFVHRPTNGIDLILRDKQGEKLLPLIGHFVEHLTFSYHFSWDPESPNFAAHEKMLDKYLDFIDHASHYTAAKFFRVITNERETAHTLSLADRVLKKGSIFFDFGIHDGKGNFSTDNQQAVPTQQQLELQNLGLFARLLFMDQMVETNLDYLLMVPAFGDHYLNCGGHTKAVLVVRAEKDGTPVLDTCSEVQTNVPFPADLKSENWKQIQDKAAHDCGNCRQQCEYPFKWNRDFKKGSMRPLTLITTARQIGKGIRTQGFEKPISLRATPYRREQLTDQTFIKKLLQARANMVRDRFTMPYWQEQAKLAGMTPQDIETVVKRYEDEANSETFLKEYQFLEQYVARITNGGYPEENWWHNKAWHTIATIWGGGFLLEGPLIRTPREEIILYAPARYMSKIKAKTIFAKE